MLTLDCTGFDALMRMMPTRHEWMHKFCANYFFSRMTKN